MHSRHFYANCVGDVASISITAGALKLDKNDQILKCNIALQAAADSVYDAPESQFLLCWHPPSLVCRTGHAIGWQPA